jgi:hypothetical protein
MAKRQFILCKGGKDMDFKRITIFSGNYGSGKTELAINYALLLNNNFSNVALADIDVVNPYFRSREKAEFLEKEGIKIIFPKRLAHADLPIISADLYSIIEDENIYGVLDVGGDDDGAIALGSVSKRLKDEDYEMNLVVNTMRPFTSSVEGIIDIKEKIEIVSHLKFNNIICNINLGRETELKYIKKGYSIVKEASKKMALPLKFIAIREDLFPLKDDFRVDEEIFPIKIYMNPPWVR